ncbi:putative reverse transcriptase domain-containing protein [Tanacetum coccineum]
MPKSSLQLVDEVVDEGVPEKEPAHDDEEANLQRALELSLKEQGEQTQGPARPVVIREPNSGRIQPLPKVQGKGKEKVSEEQAAHDLPTLQTLKPKNLADQFNFQRRTPMPTEPSEHADSPSLDAELALTDSETESEEEVPVIKARDQDEGQAGPNPGKHDEGQAGSNPCDAAKSQPQPSHMVHAGPNLEHMDLETTDVSTQQKPEQMDEEVTTTAYPNEEEPGKTNAKVEVQSMVSVPIHQDTSSVPPMTTPVIDLTKSQYDSPLLTSTVTTSTITIATTLPPPPLQSTTDPILVRRIAPLRARFRDLPTVDMKEILQQRMFEKNTYKTHEVHNDLYEALQKLVELDYSNQCLADQEEARKKKIKRHESPRTPFGSPPTQPPPPPPLAGASGVPGTSGASGSSQLPPPPPFPSTGTSGSA